MAKGAKALAADMKARDLQAHTDAQAALASALTPSAAESQNEKDRSAYYAWRDKGDFRSPPPSLVGLNYGPDAARRRQLEQGAVGTGILGMGAENADPTAIALAKQNLNDTNAEEDANAYQGAISAEDTYQRTGNSQSLMAQDFARKMGLLNNTGSMEQFSTQKRIDTQPQSMLPMLLSGLISGGAAFATGGLSAGLSKGGAFGSDSRLKENIQKLHGMSAVRFEWAAAARDSFGYRPGQVAIGLMADETEKAFPEFVEVSPTGYKTIDYMGLSAYLIEMIKEMNQERRILAA